ncbi:pre-mRNA-splicing factor CWC22 homolog [Scaptodrosophila lebanonensis]|uniref:Pre-mRNA-splicing factor CWC22 homolog n=1 Tax=Drosophila lebanonensis TaxID=7225 RepID=A0A6J2UGY0_DROLE|nr:pre-mRNA-splicing factor CWC22 homolog [Scaptodrosophila lebanonensis]
MKFAILPNQYMVLVLALALVSMGQLSLVSGRGASTPAPLATSTVKPTSAPKMEAAHTKPTRPMMIINAPPQKQKHLVPANVPAAEPQTVVEQLPVGHAEHLEPMHLKSTPLQVRDAKPLQVTGFITKTGNIYEIEDQKGMGVIESRQAADEEGQIVCNYGNVIIYSDVPCDQVSSSIQVGEVQQLSGNKNDSDQQMSAEASTEKPVEEAEQQAPAADAADTAVAANGSNTPRQQSQRQGQRQGQRRRRRRPQQQKLKQQRRRQKQHRRKNQQKNRRQQQRRRPHSGRRQIVRQTA